MVAQRGDETEEMEVEEIRTVRLLDNTADQVNNEMEMDVDRARREGDDARERTKANNKGRGQDGKNRD